jgi:hypothetical protein
MSNMGYVKALTVTNMQIINTKIGCKIGQSSKIRCDVLICAGVGEPSRSRNIPNSKMSRGLMSDATKLGTMGSCVPKTEAQLAAYMLLSKPLPSTRIALGLLPVVWPPICSRLAPVMGSETVAVGMPITSRATPIAAKVGTMMRHVARVRRKHPPSKFYLIMWQMWGDKEFLSFISRKMEWESPPSILVTRNPYWSQRSGMGTGCVKGRY